ncbi:unnamed protein product [Closterium sp. NIES-53]
MSRAAPAPPATADVSTRSQWLSRDATARLAIRNHLPATECAHFGEHRTAQALLLLPYLFPELSAFATVADLVTHLRTSDARYRATVPAEFLPMNKPPMFITLYFIVTRLPDSLRSGKGGRGSGGGSGGGGGGGGRGSGGSGRGGGGGGGGGSGGTGGGGGGSGGGGGGSGGSGGSGGGVTSGGRSGPQRGGPGGGRGQQ